MASGPSAAAAAGAAAAALLQRQLLQGSGEGWSEHQTGDGRKFFHNEETGVSQWEKPDTLMSESERIVNSGEWKQYRIWDGRIFYYNKETKVSCWSMPPELRKLRGESTGLDDRPLAETGAERRHAFQDFLKQKGVDATWDWRRVQSLAREAPQAQGLSEQMQKQVFAEVLSMELRKKEIQDNTEFHAAIAGAVAGAYHARAVAEQYGVPVILHTDHCAKNLLPWFDGLLEADERYFERHGEPLFSSHMLDLSEEPLEENVEICVKYLERMAKINCGLEMELGITGGEEDGVNNEDANPEDLYSKPEEIYQVYDALSKVPNGFFTIAAAFGNVHGVYQPGNVKLEPTILDKAQKFISEKIGEPEGSKPVSFVFHGGSGSDIKDIREAVDYGVIKMNIDTDTQWSYWNGIRDFETKYHDYLQTQIGNPDGKDKPNKKYYDPRACIRSAEESTVKRMEQCFEDLRCVNVLGLGPPDTPKNVMGPRRGGLPS